MNSGKFQNGVGLVEVLVALLLLSLAILGFVALQLKAVDATSEARLRIQAANLAQDLSERIRANPGQLSIYQTKLNASSQVYDSSVQALCIGTAVTPVNMAACDSAQVIARAKYFNLNIAMPTCSGMSTSIRSCIYVSWSETNPTDGPDSQDCTKDGIYNANANCIVLESY